jgi:hypothetical protein
VQSDVSVHVYSDSVANVEGRGGKVLMKILGCDGWRENYITNNLHCKPVTVMESKWFQVRGSCSSWGK